MVNLLLLPPTVKLLLLLPFAGTTWEVGSRVDIVRAPITGRDLYTTSFQCAYITFDLMVRRWTMGGEA